MLTKQQQIFEQVEKANKILITFNKDWNGDAVASGLAVASLLKKMDKKADLIAQDPDKGKSDFAFLPGFDHIAGSMDDLRRFIISLDITNAKVGGVKYKIVDNTLNFVITPKEGFFSADDISSRKGNFKYDLVIVLDSPDLESLGKIYADNTEFFYNTPVINIDHSSRNESFGQINQVELTASSTCEAVFNLVKSQSRELIDEDMATCLLAGIIHKTRNFRTHKISPQTLSAASQLISMGGRREEIVNELYRSRPLNVLKLWGRVLARLNSSKDRRLVWSLLAKNDFEKTGTKESDLPEIISELITSIPQSKIIILISETDKGSRVLVHTDKNLDSLELAKQWKAAGDSNQAYFSLDKPLKEAQQEVVEKIAKQIEGLDLS